MGELFDLLQRQVQSRDGVCDCSLLKEKQASKKTRETLTRVSAALCVVLCGVTSGGVFAGGVVSEALDEALDGEGLTDTFESLVASFATLPFTCKRKCQ